jgi:Sigma-70 region 2
VTVDGREYLAEQFEAHRAHLRAVAYRMLGSVSEADDALQESWLRLSRSDPSRIENRPPRGSSPAARPALVNGAAGFVVAPQGRPVAVAGFTVADEKSSRSICSPIPSAFPG